MISDLALKKIHFNLQKLNLSNSNRESLIILTIAGFTNHSINESRKEDAGSRRVPGGSEVMRKWGARSRLNQDEVCMINLLGNFWYCNSCKKVSKRTYMTWSNAGWALGAKGLSREGIGTTDWENEGVGNELAKTKDAWRSLMKPH